MAILGLARGWPFFYGGYNVKHAIFGAVAVVSAAFSPLALAESVVSCTAHAELARADGFSPSAFRAWMVQAIGPKSVWTCSNGQHGSFTEVSHGKTLVSLSPYAYAVKKGTGPVQEYQYPLALFAKR